jgi:hypothetical protein
VAKVAMGNYDHQRWLPLLNGGGFNYIGRLMKTILPIVVFSVAWTLMAVAGPAKVSEVLMADRCCPT